MFSRFFIDRPIFATVLSIVITLAGGVALFNLPLAQYPQITPPSITVSCTYPGASAQVVAESVAAPIEQQVNGVEDMIYMSSASANDGSYSLSVTFKPGVDLNFAQVLVQNRVNLALPLLPDVVKQTGVTTRKRNPDILLIVSIYSPNDRYDQVYVSNYATIHLLDEVARVDGVGDVHIFGQQDYSMRVWVDPDRLASRNLTAGDVIAALREQNMQVAAGEVGQPPSTAGVPFEFTVNTVGRLSDPAQFADVVLKTGADGRKVCIRDIGRVELGARNKDVSSKIDGHGCASIAVWQLPYANALQTADNVRARMDELKENFPQGIDYQIAYDTTPFIRESINGVFHTLIEAIVLVAVVVLVFLQNWRSTIIPLTAVPVAIIGTFAAMAAIGFSLNNLTLFGLVLAIGIVVDDAIVVVEAVEHHIEEGMQPKQAALQAMREVSGPVIAVALVLSAVFVPCAFISGITGQFFRQFALTIAVSTVISAFNSLTLSPALAALLLQGRSARKDVVGRTLDLSLGWFFRLFNWTFRRCTGLYTRVVGLALRGSALVLLVYGGLLLLTWWTSTRLPTGYIPVMDQSKLYAAIQLPDSASLERTQAVVDRVTEICHNTRGVIHTLSVGGQSFSLGANGSNFGNLFITLDAFDKRHDPALYSDRIAAELRREDRQEGARSDRHHPRAAGGVRPRLGGRLQVHGRGPQRQRRSPEPANADQPAHRRRPERPETGHPAHGVPRRFAAAVRRAGPQAVPDDGRQPAGRFHHIAGLPRLLLRQRLQRLRPHLAGGGPGRGAVPQRPGGGQAAPGAQRRRRHGPARRRAQGAAATRPADPVALQHVPRGRHRRQHEARRQLRRGHHRDGAAGQADAAAGHELRVDRDQFHPGGRRQERLEQPDLPAGGGVRVSGAGGAVRELGVAAGRHPRRADVHPRLADRRGVHPLGLAGATGSACPPRIRTSTSSRRSASWCWSAWPARTRS